MIIKAEITGRGFESDVACLAPRKKGVKGRWMMDVGIVMLGDHM